MTAVYDIYRTCYPRNSDFKKFLDWYGTVPYTFDIAADTHWHLVHLVPWYGTHKCYSSVCISGLNTVLSSMLSMVYNVNT
jgi:hypothetical protein